MIIWVAPISAYFFKWDIVYLVKKYVLAINPSQLWFLWMLFWVFVIVWPFRKVVMEKPKIACVIALLFFVISFVGNRFIPNIFCIWKACQYIPLFFIGMRIRVKEENRGKMLTEVVPWFCWIGIDLVIFACSIMIGQFNGILWNLMSEGINFILHIVGAIMAWTTLQLVAKKVNWQKNKFFSLLSSYSMPMYLFHQQVIYFTIIWLNGKVSPWINAGINFVVALIISFVISSILMRRKTTRFLIGER